MSVSVTQDSTHSHTASASACCQGAPALTSSPLPLSSCNPQRFLLPPPPTTPLPLSCMHPLPHHCDNPFTLPSFFPCWFSAALQGMENCVVRWMVVIPITPLMQQGSSKVENNWQVPAAFPFQQRACVFVCVCGRDERGLLWVQPSEVISLIISSCDGCIFCSQHALTKHLAFNDEDKKEKERWSVMQK